MTIVIGMLRDNGLIMGADTEETAEDYKRSVAKLPIYTNSSRCSLIVGGAGPDFQIETVTQALWEDFDGATRENKKEIEAKFRDTIKKHYKDHVLSWPSALERDDNDFSLLLGATFSLNADHALNYLWIAQKGMLRKAYAHAAIGTGANFARTLLDDHLGMYSLEMAVLIAISILQKVKRNTPYCGKESQVWALMGWGTPVFPDLVQEAEEVFKKYELSQMKHFFTTISGGGDADDKVQGKMLTEEFKDFRKHFRVLTVKISKQLKAVQRNNPAASQT